jgi:hypothetical protein
MGRRFESCRAHHITFCYGYTCSIPDYYLWNHIFGTVPRTVPTEPRNGGEHCILRGVHVPAGDRYRAVSSNPSKGPSVTPRLAEPGQESMAKAVEHKGATPESFSAFACCFLRLEWLMWPAFIGAGQIQPAESRPEASHLFSVQIVGTIPYIV